MYRRVFFIVLIVSVVTSLLFYLSYKNKKVTPLPTVKINNLEIPVIVADTPEKKGQGLSGTSLLDSDKGMLFIFRDKSQPSFWMIDMNYPLDLVWISDNKVAAIDANVPNPKPGTPASELPLYTPPVGIDYVLEVNAGFTEKHGIKVGDTVDFTKIE